MITLLQIYCWTWRWKNFEYQSTFSKVMGKLQCPFLTHMVHMASLKLQLLSQMCMKKQQSLATDR